jgi:hypothetical protein
LGTTDATRRGHDLTALGNHRHATKDQLLLDDAMFQEGIRCVRHADIRRAKDVQISAPTLHLIVMQPTFDDQ